MDKYSTCVECKARLPFEHLSKNSMCRDCLLLNSEGRSHRIVRENQATDFHRHRIAEVMEYYSISRSDG